MDEKAKPREKKKLCTAKTELSSEEDPSGAEQSEKRPPPPRASAPQRQQNSAIAIKARHSHPPNADQKAPSATPSHEQNKNGKEVSLHQLLQTSTSQQSIEEFHHHSHASYVKSLHPSAIWLFKTKTLRGPKEPSPRRARASIPPSCDQDLCSPSVQ